MQHIRRTLRLQQNPPTCRCVRGAGIPRFGRFLSLRYAAPPNSNALLRFVIKATPRAGGVRSVSIGWPSRLFQDFDKQNKLWLGTELWKWPTNSKSLENVRTKVCGCSDADFARVWNPPADTRFVRTNPSYANMSGHWQMESSTDLHADLLHRTTIP